MPPLFSSLRAGRIVRPALFQMTVEPRALPRALPRASRLISLGAARGAHPPVAAAGRLSVEAGSSRRRLDV